MDVAIAINAEDNEQKNLLDLSSRKIELKINRPRDKHP
jgi:hypothetical protein